MVELSHYIFPVRAGLSDVEIEYDGDDLIYQDLKSAFSFASNICVAPTDDPSMSYFMDAVVALATYYNYLTYTSLAEKRLGELPPTSYIRIRALRAKAWSFLALISKYPLTEDLVIDTSIFEKTPGIGFNSLDSVLST